MAGLLGSQVDWGRPMLDIGGGSSFNVWKDVAVMLLLAVGILIFIPPSSSTSPAFQRPPSTSSFFRIVPPDTLRALHQNTTIPTGTIVTLVVIIVASSVFDSSSCIKMVADVDCPDRLHTVVRQFAPMSMREVLKGMGDGDEFEGMMLPWWMEKQQCCLHQGLMWALGAGYMQSRALGAARCAKSI
ncbi:hypothetical protein ARMGADRAFT_1035573 [Armillaria gallica]|uniref:Uncharacterized protein n=1 Tax=Armillaria gallica TaxID=47427 RepID=A0A2H3CTK5_ARMGA|nr:hypothetical protein ARMGADRAFT_1035573 [Armillaria gallica]